jgi:hypothetical protein
MSKGLAAQVIASAIEATVRDMKLLAQAKKTAQLLLYGGEKLPNNSAEAKEHMAANRASVQVLHDVACAWLDAHDKEVQWLEEKAAEYRAEKNSQEEGFDFSAVFGGTSLQ